MNVKFQSSRNARCDLHADGNRFARGALVGSTQESAQVQAFVVSVFVQSRNSTVPDKDRADLYVAAVGWRWHFEIENADAKALFSVVCATVA